MQKKNQKIFFDFYINAFELLVLNTRSYWERILFIGCHYVNNKSQDFRYYSDRIFRAHFLPEWWKNMTKILRCRLKQCFGAFQMLTGDKCSHTRLFSHLSNPTFCSGKIQKQITSEAYFFSQSIQNFM